MRDPMSWALPLGRLFGIQIRVHLLFFIVTFGLFFRFLLMKDNPIWWVDLLFFTIFLLFFIILLHEFGHCFGARYVEGEAKEVLIWPLGGLAFVDVPHTPRATFIATAAGPAVNVVICIACTIGLALGGFLPNANPLANPFVSEIKSFRDHGRTYTSPYGLKLYKPDSNEPMPEQEAIDKAMKEANSRQLQDVAVFSPARANEIAKSSAAQGYERALAPGWATWLNRAFYLSWVLFLFNLVPAYPLDGGQMLQSIVWARSDYRRGVTLAAYSGYVCAVIFLVVSIAFNESLFACLSIFMFYAAWIKLYQLDAEDGPFGYDFSAGYTSLEKDEEKPKPPKRVGWFTRWRQARRARKLQREVEERQRDEERMDQLLEKIAREGKESLTDEERRFLERVSARKRNMS